MDHVAPPTLDDVERDYILSVRRRCDGNRTRASKLLGISVRGLRIKLAAYFEHGHQVPEPGISGRAAGPLACAVPSGGRQPCLDSYVRHQLGLYLRIFYEGLASGPMPRDLTVLASQLDGLSSQSGDSSRIAA
jgi:hypothetical protein